MHKVPMLANRVLALLIALGLKEGRRRCCGCGESEVTVGELLSCRRILDKREIRSRADGAIYSTLASRSCWVLPRVCRSCDAHIQKLQISMVSLEVRIWFRDNGVCRMQIVESSNGISLRRMLAPALSLIPPQQPSEKTS